MFARHRHELRRHRYAWLLLFALWLPLAQAAALCHLIGHHGRIVALQDDAGIGQEPCSTCLTAATLVGGAITDAAAPAALPPPDGTQPRLPPPHTDFERAPLPYLSRAPPLASS